MADPVLTNRDLYPEDYAGSDPWSQARVAMGNGLMIPADALRQSYLNNVPELKPYISSLAGWAQQGASGVAGQPVPYRAPTLREAGTQDASTSVMSLLRRLLLGQNPVGGQ